MQISFGKTSVIVTRGTTDPKIYSESVFWHKLKTELNKTGEHDLIKKVMSKDGHMVGGDEYPYYLRDRKWRYCIHDANYMLAKVNYGYNEGRVQLVLHRWDE
jgi:hypothetical protein